MSIKPTPLHTAKIRFFVALCTLFGLPITTALRFMPKEQKRLDLRGRTIATYEFFGDALNDLKNIHAGTYHYKEPEHGSYYLAVEIRSSSAERLGIGRRSKDTVTIPLPLNVSQGVSETARAVAHASDAAQATHDASDRTGAHGKGHERDAGSEKAPRATGPVDRVDLSALDV